MNITLDVLFNIQLKEGNLPTEPPIDEILQFFQFKTVKQLETRVSFMIKFTCRHSQIGLEARQAEHTVERSEDPQQRS